jgi:hypothetical protein
VLVLAGLVLLPVPAIGWLKRYPLLSHDVENAAHPLIFAAIALLVLRIARPWCERTHRPPGLCYAISLGTALLLGAATETAQLFEVARDASLEDLVNDVLGAGFALSLYARRSIVAALCALLIGLPLAWTGAAYLHRQAELPRLWNRKSLLDRPFFSEHDGDYPGMGLEEPWPDWSGYRELQIDVSNRTRERVNVYLLVHDRQHHFVYQDRYNEEFTLPAASRQTLHVPIQRIENAPAGRKMDLRQIAGVVVFRAREDLAREVVVEEIRLAH